MSDVELRIGPPLHFDRLLGLAARPTPSDEQRASFAREARTYDGWSTLAARAEAHGIAPLVQHHLEASGADAPRHVRRAMAGLAVRHRRANAIRATLLAEIGEAFRARGVPVLFLKGSALAFFAYPDPSLRAMRDTDLLVRERDLAIAGEILAKLGYAAGDERSWATDLSFHHHHQPDRRRVVRDLTVSVEVHRRLGIRDTRARRTLEDLEAASVPFTIDGTELRTLGPVDMLVHVHYHGFKTPLSWPDRTRLVSAADLAALVELWVDRLDWSALRARHPALVQSLAWLDVVSPWSARAAAALGIDRGAAPSRVGADYRGWPRERISERRDRARHFADTLFPPAWWLRVRHGGRPGKAGLAATWVRHALDLF
jgi:hypothetical protein